MTVENFDRRLAAGIRWSFLGLAFFLPLVLSTRSSEVFELPKMVLVYAATAVIVGLWLSRMALRRQILVRQTPLDIPILLFLLSQIASTIYSIDPYVSWWGWYGRFHGGLWSTVSYTLLYYAFVSNLSVIGFPFSVFSSKFVGYRFTGLKPMDREPINHKPTTENRGLITVALASAAVVSVYAILQHFGVDKDFWVQDVVNRVFSTQGQPNWLAGYIVMAAPLALAMTIMSNEKEVMSNEEKKNKSALFSTHYFLLIILFLSLLFTKSRSGLIGLAVADLIFWSLIFFQFYLLKNISYIDQQRSFKKEPTFSGTKKLYRLSTIVHNLYNFVDRNREKTGWVNLAKSFVLIHILMAGLILATNNPAREWMFKNKIAAVATLPRNDEMRKSELGGTESGDIRAVVWSGAVQLVKQRPVFGFGPETFGETYWRVRPKEHNLTSEWNFLYNKAHNEWLNLAANTGMFGLGSHLLLLGWFSAWVLKGPALPRPACRRGRQGRALSSYAILAALIGVEAVNFFGFSTVTVGAYRYLFMAAAVSIAANDDNKLLKSMPDRAVSSVIQGVISRRQKIITAALTLFILYLLSKVFIFFIADLSYSRGRAYQDSGYVEEAVEPLIRAVNLAPGEPVFRAELAEAEGAAAALLPQQRIENTRLPARQGEQRTENSDILSETITQLKTDSIANFEIVRRQSPQNLGFIRTQAKVLFNMRNIDPALGEEAVQLMKAAMEMAPTNPQLPYSLGQMLSKMGNKEEAAVYYNKAVELKPDYEAAK